MRILARIGAFILIFAGVIAVAAAVVTMKTVGKNDVIMMQPSTLHTKSAAITTAKGLLSVYGSDLHINVAATDPKEKLWLGVAYQDDLDSYLGNSSRTQVVAFSYPSRLVTDAYNGTNSALTAPRTLDWWLDTATGTGTAQLVWTMQNAPCGIVIMNQSGKPDVDAKVTVGLQVKGVYKTAEIVGAGGVVAILLGVLIFIITRRRQPKHSAAATAEELR